MRAVGNHRGTRTISLALTAGLLAFAAVLFVGAVWLPGSFLIRTADEKDAARKLQGGETVITKLEEAEADDEAQTAPDAPLSFKGLGDIPWNREEAPEEAKPRPKVFADSTKVTDALPWDAIEPVPFDPGITRDTVKRKTSIPESAVRAETQPPAQLVELPKIELPASGDVGRWVKAKAKTLKGENRGRPIYHFEFWLDAPAEVKKRLVAVAYDFNTPAVLPQSQVSSEEQTGFRVAVGGLACSDNVTVTLTFDDGRSQQAAVDGCRLLS